MYMERMSGGSYEKQFERQLNRICRGKMRSNQPYEKAEVVYEVMKLNSKGMKINNDEQWLEVLKVTAEGILLTRDGGRQDYR